MHPYIFFVGLAMHAPFYVVLIYKGKRYCETNIKVR